MQLLNKTIISSLVFSFGTIQGAEKPKTAKPNVISIYTDDQGAIDLNCFGATDLVTPNMDKLVNSGIKFTQFYGAPVCSPSRAGLLTGKTPQRAGVPGNVSSLSMEAGMPSEQYTIAEMFKDAGYKTAHIGKWHLGHSEDNSQMHRVLNTLLDILSGALIIIPISFFGKAPTGTTFTGMAKRYFTQGNFSPTSC
jgi:hypothetical protein